MNWFKKALIRYANKLQSSHLVEPKAARGLLSISVDEEETVTSNTLNFRVTPAQGGVILSLRIYDRHKDTSTNSLHIITLDQDYATEIGKIVAMELYKR